MNVLTTNSTRFLEQLAPDKRKVPDSLAINQSMNSRHTCSCCSYTLFRHFSLGKLYWRCSHCYQAMPVIEDAGEMPAIVRDETLFQQVSLFRDRLDNQWNTDCALCRAISHSNKPPLLSVQRDSKNLGCL
jgi:ribosomal protein L37AE/L43A